MGCWIFRLEMINWSRLVIFLLKLVASSLEPADDLEINHEIKQEEPNENDLKMKQLLEKKRSDHKVALEAVQALKVAAPWRMSKLVEATGDEEHNVKRARVQKPPMKGSVARASTDLAAGLGVENIP